MLQALCAASGIALVEDAAHAHGSSLDGRSAGTFGVAGTFSFYPTKVMAGGEGGMIVTDDAHLADERPASRDQGKASFLTNLHTRLGQQLAHERAARGDRAHPAAAAGRVHRPSRPGSPSVHPPPLPELGFTPSRVPDGAVTNWYKLIAYSAPGTDRVVLKKRLREGGVALSGRGLRRSRSHLQPVFERWAEGPLLRNGGALRPPRLPPHLWR